MVWREEKPKPETLTSVNGEDAWNYQNGCFKDYYQHKEVDLGFLSYLLLKE